MQRKGKIKYNIRDKLHSIPKLKKNVKSNVVYSIPSIAVVALLVGSVISLNPQWFCISSSSSAYAAEENVSTTADDDLGTTNEASLSLENYKLTANAVQGTQALASTEVTVNVTNAESYSLILSVEDEDLVNGDTIIKAGNAADDDTWGYAWSAGIAVGMPLNDGESVDELDLSSLTLPGRLFRPPSTAGVALMNGSGSEQIRGTLTFAAKFSDNATSGTYGTRGTLSLSVTPKKVAEIGEWTLPDGTIKPSGITTMQEMTPAICEQVSTPIASEVIASGKTPIMTLTDSRDNNTYAIAKYPDGKCWMTQNLTIMGSRTLTSADSNVSADYSLPASNVISFDTTQTTQAAYLGADSNGVATGYYTWCAATAGTCSSATSYGANAPSSICPKGWRLPGGYTDATYGNEFRNLFLNMGLTISNSSLANSSGSGTSWGTGDLSKAQSSPYNFNYTGYVGNGSYSAPASNQYGYWWSSTADSSISACLMYVGSRNAYPGTGNDDRYVGYAVRCVAKEAATFSVTYDPSSTDGYVLNHYSVDKFSADFPVQESFSTGSSVTFTAPTLTSQTIYGRSTVESSSNFQNYQITGWTTVKGSTTAQYASGATITVNSPNPHITLYPVWKAISSGGSLS